MLELGSEQSKEWRRLVLFPEEKFFAGQLFQCKSSLLWCFDE